MPSMHPLQMPAYHVKALDDLPKKQVTLLLVDTPEAWEVSSLSVSLTLGPRLLFEAMKMKSSSWDSIRHQSASPAD